MDTSFCLKNVEKNSETRPNFPNVDSYSNISWNIQSSHNGIGREGEKNYYKYSALLYLL